MLCTWWNVLHSTAKWLLWLMYRDRTKCVDINECTETRNGGCNMDCINTQGSFFCACSDSYILDTDERTCIGNLLCLPLISTVGFMGSELMINILNLYMNEQNLCVPFFTATKLCFIIVIHVIILKYYVILLVTKTLTLLDFYLINMLCKIKWIFWNGFSHSSEREAGCISLAVPEHGEVRCPGHPPETKYPPGAECHIRCSKNHKLNGPHARRCGKDGRWSGDISVCVREYCSYLLLHTCPGQDFPQS